MKKLILMTLTFALLASCGKQEDEYLYNEYDGDNWQAVLALKKKDCETKNKIFAKLDETSTFSNFFEKKDVRIFKIERKFTSATNEAAQESAETQMVYVVMKKDSLSNGALELIITHSNVSTDPEFLNKKVTYTQKDNKDILNTAKTGACADEYGKAIGTDFLTIESQRKNEISKEPELYIAMNETLTFKSGYPAILHRWNGTITDINKNEYNKTTKTWKAANGIVEITSDQCRSADSACKLAIEGVNVTTQCDLDINDTHYNSKNDPAAKLTSFKNCI